MKAIDFYDFFRGLPVDTTPERIKESREKGRSMLAQMRGRDTGSLPVEAKAEGKECLRLLNEWYRYFDVGYVSSERIDGLKEKVEASLERLIERGG